MTTEVETKEKAAPQQEQPTNGVASAPQETQQQGPDLNINDLVSLKSIVEIASQRGAFKANELEAVGKTFNRLNTFIESVAPREQ
jgi:hypothetical protein